MRDEFEQWYVEHAFDLKEAPIGSRDCALQWKAYQAGRLAGAEAMRELEHLRREVEIRTMECRSAQAARDALVSKLSHIYLLMHPKDVESGGQRFKFHPPDDLVREAWEGLSKAINDIPDAIRALPLDEGGK